jgi:hypothetical protein
MRSSFHPVPFALVVLCVTTLSAGLLAPRALANGPEIGIDGGHAVPIASTAISLEAEYVRIEAPLDEGVLAGRLPGSMHCEYHLHNPLHHAVRVPMAFVVPVAEFRWSHSAPTDDPSLGLSVHLLAPYPQPGESLSVRRLPVARTAWNGLVTNVPDSLPCWTVPIPPDSTVVLLIESRVVWSSGSDGTTSGRMLTYCTRPARLWRGPIAKAEIDIKFGEAAAALLRSARPGSNLSIRIEPKGFAWTDEGIRWRFENWEPDEDCVVSLDYTLVDPEE